MVILLINTNRRALLPEATLRFMESVYIIDLGRNIR